MEDLNELIFRQKMVKKIKLKFLFNINGPE